MPKASEVFGLSIVKAPGGGLVLVAGPLDLSRAESLSPRWVRERRETRPVKTLSEPDEMGRTHAIVAPVLQKVGEEVVHGESVAPLLRRLNREGGKLLNAAMLEKAVELEVLEKLQRTAKPKQKPHKESANEKRIRAERALGFFGKSDDVVRRELLKLGRKPEDVERYIKGRRAAA